MASVDAPGDLGDLVLLDLSTEGVAVDPEVLRGAGEVAPVALDDAGNEALFELPLGVGKANSLVDHLDNQRVQLLLHGDDAP